MIKFIAFANGAPDIISAFSAGNEQDGIFISMGSLFGAALFSYTIILAKCIYKSPTK